MNPIGQKEQSRHHISRRDWLTTLTGKPRGYIQPDILRELWFHTGTICNLQCPFCFEGSKPGDDRLNKISLDDVRPFIDEALGLGVEKFSFTGGEPFVIKDMVNILSYALEHRPCLVLTNATEPLKKRLHEIQILKGKPSSLCFRVSIDHPDAQKHDAGRGIGNFALAWETIKELHRQGFPVSIARQRGKDEDQDMADQAYDEHLKNAGLPLSTPIVSFPDLLTPQAVAQAPEVTENCMTRYHNERSRDRFMCNFSKMIVKRNGQMRVYACTLVDDDPDYDFGERLDASMDVRVMLKHHRCYSCFAQGVSCSE